MRQADSSYAISSRRPRPTTWKEIRDEGRRNELTALLEFIEEGPSRPSETKDWLQQGRAWASLGNMNRAVRAYSEALAHDARDYQIYLERARALVEQGYFDRAIRDLDEAVKFKPKDPLVHYNRARTYSLSHRASESMKGLREAISRDAEFREAARADEDFANLRSDPKHGSEFERLVAEPED